MLPSNAILQAKDTAVVKYGVQQLSNDIHLWTFFPARGHPYKIIQLNNCIEKPNNTVDAAR